jgi:hypothetical protein
VEGDDGDDSQTHQSRASLRKAMHLRVSSEAGSRRLHHVWFRGAPAAPRKIHERVLKRQSSADANIAIRVSESLSPLGARDSHAGNIKLRLPSLEYSWMTATIWEMKRRKGKTRDSIGGKRGSTVEVGKEDSEEAGTETDAPHGQIRVCGALRGLVEMSR